MVAIQVLPLEPDDWYDDDLDAGQADPRREQQWRPLAVPAARPRPLPSRATRIRRRRLCAVVLAAALLLAVVALVDVVVGSSGGGPRVIPDTGPRPITEDVYVVQPGDTLWTIAQRLAPDADPRPIVAELRELNGGVALDVGDRLDVGEV